MPQVNMRIVNAQSIDLEIQQFLIQTGCDRDFAIKTIVDWFSILKRSNAITTYNVNPVLNNTLQFSVTCSFPGFTRVFNKIYSVASTNSMPASPAKQPYVSGTMHTPPPAPPPYDPGVNAKNPKKPESKKKELDTDEAWKRSMRGI